MTQNITLYSWGGADGCESASPFCLKVIGALRYKKLPFETQLVTMRMPPWVRRGTLPALEIDGEKHEDSSHILQALDATFPQSPRLYPTDKASLAETILLEDWADEVLALHVVHSRWGVEANFTMFFEQIGGMIPKPLRGTIGRRVRKGALKSLKARGIAYDTDEQRRRHFEAGLDALEARVGRDAFLVGSAPTAADFAAFGSLVIVEAARTPDLWPALNQRSGLKRWLAAMKDLALEQSAKSA